MTPDQLYDHIEMLINNKKTHPRVITFVDLRCSVSGDHKVLRESFKKLLEDKRVRVREGKNSNLIELCIK